MQHLLVPSLGGAYVPQAVLDLEKRLRLIDPDLSVNVGILADQHGNERYRRYEVWRHCEDGADRMLGAWKLEEVGQIELDLAVMRARAAGRVPDAITSIDAHNAQAEAEADTRYDDAVAAIKDHGQFANPKAPDRAWRSHSFAREARNKGGGGRRKR